MKYLITESQAKMAATFLKLDMKNFIQIEKRDKIYFVNSENDKYAQIRFDKDDGWCFINFGLIKEISSWFSLEESDSKQFIGRWVENTLQMRVANTFKGRGEPSNLLKIPFK